MAVRTAVIDHSATGNGRALAVAEGAAGDAGLAAARAQSARVTIAARLRAEALAG